MSFVGLLNWAFLILGIVIVVFSIATKKPKSSKFAAIPIGLYILLRGLLDVYWGTYSTYAHIGFYDLYHGRLQFIVGSLPYTSAILAGAIWLVLAVIAFLLIFMILPKILGDKSSTKDNTYNGTNTQSGGVVNSDGYFDMAKHVLLLLFTFGIWYLIWIYRTTGYLNQVNDEPPRNPTTKLLLCMFVPFYMIYWVYKSAQRLDKLAASKGVSSDLSTLCLILAIFIGIIPPILMQSKMNDICTSGNKAVSNQSSVTSQVNTVSSSQQLGAANEVKALKELLDSGIITQEEFDTKKKQLLGL